jgi:hypothetical protein
MSEDGEMPVKKGSYVLLDANIWRSNYMLRTPTGAGLLYSIKQLAFNIALPEIIEEEVVKHMIKAGIDANQNIDKNFRAIAMLVGFRSEYDLPALEEFEKYARDRFAELNSLIVRVPFTIEHAKSALNKVFLELPPNGPKNQQFKDSAIWEVILDLTRTHDIYFVSNDNGYYKDRDPKRGLANNLQDELQGVEGRVYMFQELSQLLKELQKDTPPLNMRTLAETIDQRIRTDLNITVGKRGFELHELVNFTILPYITERINVLAIEYSLKYEAIDISSDETTRNEPAITASGSCYYNLDDNIVFDLRQGNEEFTWLDEEGQIQQNKNLYGYMEGFLGRRSIPYKGSRSI